MQCSGTMKQIHYKIRLIQFGMILLSAALITACTSSREGKTSKSIKNESFETYSSNLPGTGQNLEVSFRKGKAHNHPTFAIWLEDMDGKYIQTLFVTRAIGQGIFTYGDKSDGNWKPGEVRRPAALPYWGHKRGIKASDGLYIPSPENPVPDAYSGATPSGNFKLQTRPDLKMAGKFKLMMEINQTWDWNEFWTNNLYPGDLNYKTSCQPSLIYSAEIDFSNPASGSYTLTPIGHGHYSGKDGSLNTDLSTITTALTIASEISVRLIRE